MADFLDRLIQLFIGRPARRLLGLTALTAIGSATIFWTVTHSVFDLLGCVARATTYLVVCGAYWDRRDRRAEFGRETQSAVDRP